MKNTERYEGPTFGTNPCSEIILRSREFCNLSEVVIRREDKEKDIARKVRFATILGTIQSTLTNFKYLSKEWKNNCEEERLLGVSLTGIMDNDITANPNSQMLENLKSVAVETNKFYAEAIGIARSASITCVKPSGTVSQLVDSSSGIHARHSDYYIRTVRMDNKDPLCKFMQTIEWPNEPDVMKPNDTSVFSFPVASPKDSITRNEMSAIQQLKVWKAYQAHWCHHKPSITVTVKENEWMEIGSWVFNNFKIMSGVSFLPHSDHSYRQAPYEECDEKTFLDLKKKITEADWDKLSEFEQEDYTVASQELACSGISCEL